MKRRVVRCPSCGSTIVHADEGRSVVDLTFMQCDGCGRGALVDGWELDFDWSIDIDLADGAPLPAIVAPLAPGAGLHDPLPPATATTTATPFGCPRCWGRDAAEAWTALGSVRLQVLVAESHFSVRLSACDCGQRFVVVFTERVDWQGGEDDQCWLAMPVTADEAAGLVATNQDRVGGVVSALDAQRRFLVRHYATGGSMALWWRERGFSIGPHD